MRTEGGVIICRFNSAADNVLGNVVDTPVGFAEFGANKENIPFLTEGLLWLRDTMSKLKFLREAENFAKEGFVLAFTMGGEGNAVPVR
jgi:hypothetical protein